ncbi:MULTISPECIES: tail completion protein gp17 [Pseudoalteromonas]|uniref:tail completion protein gp17 n=1 Tax=Pseudoalteromonas TaxID=53246 RepID=UPI00272B5C19|nr:DUF3168 domain-containing protein [Pseudoalteromonas sp.]
MIEEAITSVLYKINDEVFHLKIPADATLPAITWRLVNESNDDETLDQTAGRKVVVQISAVAKSARESSALAKTIRKSLKDETGTYGDITISLIKERQTIPDFSGDPDRHSKIIDFNFHYGEDND